jgi:hypothetical protein
LHPALEMIARRSLRAVACHQANRRTHRQIDTGSSSPPD